MIRELKIILNAFVDVVLVAAFLAVGFYTVVGIIGLIVIMGGHLTV